MSPTPRGSRYPERMRKPEVTVPDTEKPAELVVIDDVLLMGGEVPELAELPQDTRLAFVKGAVDGLLQHTTAVWDSGTAVPFDESWSARISAGNDALAAAGMRVLGVAFRHMSLMGTCWSIPWYDAHFTCSPAPRTPVPEKVSTSVCGPAGMAASGR